MVSVCHDSEMNRGRLSGESTPSLLSACLQQPHQTQQDRKETHRGRPQRAQHTDRDLTLSSTTGALLRDKYALKHQHSQESLRGNSLQPLTLIPHTPNICIQHLDSFLVELVLKKMVRERQKKKEEKFRQLIKVFYVGHTVTESVNHSANLSVSLPCSDVTVVIMTRPTILLSDWTSAAVQTSVTSMAGKRKTKTPHS